MKHKRLIDRPGPKSLAMVASGLTIIWLGPITLIRHGLLPKDILAWLGLISGLILMGLLTHAGVRFVYWVIDGFLEWKDD